MANTATPNDPLAELDRRQDEVFAQLDELDRRIELALREFTALQKAASERFAPAAKTAA